MGHIPLRYKFINKEIDIHCGSSWYVNEEFRGNSMSLFFKLIGVSNESIIFTTTPSQMVMDILPRFGFDFVNKKSHTYNYIIVINYFNYIKLKFFFKSKLILKICSHVLKFFDLRRNGLIIAVILSNLIRNFSFLYKAKKTLIIH